jgi:ATP-dependent Zn protease
VAAVKLLKRQKVTRATIEARHDIGAEALVGMKDIEEIHTQTKDELLADIQISLASRACEQIFLGTNEELSGASGDLASATRLARAMIDYLGMNGSLVSEAGLNGGGLFGGGGASPASRKDVERLLDQQFKRVKMMLEEHREAVIAVAEALIEKHALMGEEVYSLVQEADMRAHVNGYRNGTNHALPTNGAYAIGSGGDPVLDRN